MNVNRYYILLVCLLFSYCAPSNAIIRGKQPEQKAAVDSLFADSSLIAVPTSYTRPYEITLSFVGGILGGSLVYLGVIYNANGSLDPIKGPCSDCTGRREAVLFGFAGATLGAIAGRHLGRNLARKKFVNKIKKGKAVTRTKKENSTANIDNY